MSAHVGDSWHTRGMDRVVRLPDAASGSDQPFCRMPSLAGAKETGHNHNQALDTDEVRATFAHRRDDRTAAISNARCVVASDFASWRHTRAVTMRARVGRSVSSVSKAQNPGSGLTTRVSAATLTHRTQANPAS